MTPTRALTHLGALLTLSASLMAMAHAAGDSDVPREVVRLNDLNMSFPKDVATLYGRITVAAQTVCPDPRAESGILANQARQCLKQAVSSAVRRINAPQLTALWQKHPYAAPVLMASRAP